MPTTSPCRRLHHSLWLRVFIGLLAVSLAAAGEPSDGVRTIDRSQADMALTLVQEGDVVRLYCKPCQDVVYTPSRVASRNLRQAGTRFWLLLDGEAVDLSEVYVEDLGETARWANLAALLGIVADRPEQLPLWVRPIERLRPHTGYFSGALGDTAVDVELRLDGRRLVGFLRTGNDPVRELLATAFNATSAGESVVLAESLGPRSTAILRGGLTAAAPHWKGERTGLDGSREAFELERVADYTYVEEAAAGVRAEAVYPVFNEERSSELSILLADEARNALRHFLEEHGLQERSVSERAAERMEGTVDRRQVAYVLLHYRPALVTVRQEVRTWTQAALPEVTFTARAWVRDDAGWREVDPDVGSAP